MKQEQTRAIRVAVLWLVSGWLSTVVQSWLPLPPLPRDPALALLVFDFWLGLPMLVAQTLILRWYFHDAWWWLLTGLVVPVSVALNEAGLGLPRLLHFTLTYAVLGAIQAWLMRRWFGPAGGWWSVAVLAAYGTLLVTQLVTVQFEFASFYSLTTAPLLAWLLMTCWPTALAGSALSAWHRGSEASGRSFRGRIARRRGASRLNDPMK